MSTAFSALGDETFRRGSRDFSRAGPLQPKLLTTLLLYMVADANRRGYRHLLEGFWDEARCHDLPLPTSEPVSAASFCVARHKITSELLRHLIHEVAQMGFGSCDEPSLQWHGRRVFAVDGAKINLQRSSELEHAFGVPEGAYCPQVLVSTLLDVCARAPVDLRVSPFGSSERQDLLEMLPRLQPGDIVVLDRGFPSHEVIQALDAARIDYLIRVPSSHTFLVVDALRESSGNDYAYWLEPPDGSPDSWRPIKVRVIRIKSPDGSESFFVTSLPRKSFSRSQLRELYHMRWEVEEFYKLSKGPYIGQGQFRSKTAAGIEQEIHALVLFLLISRVLMKTAAKAASLDFHRVSQKATVLGLAAYVTRLFLTDDQDYALRELDALLKRIVRQPYEPRPGRKYPRRSFRPRLRWGPNGRTGG